MGSLLCDIVYKYDNKQWRMFVLRNQTLHDLYWEASLVTIF